MRSFGFLVVAIVAACGSVSENKPDASTDSNPAGSGALTLAQASKWVPQNGTATVGFTIARDAVLTGPLTVRVSGLPAGVTAPDVAVAAGDSAGTLTFSATTASTVGVTTDVTVELVAASQIDSDAFGVFVAGAPGTLDTTFGTGGRLSFPLPDPVVAATTGNATVRALAQYPANAAAHANKLVVAATLDTTGTAGTTRKIAVVRFNPDGTPDLQFGTSGYAIIDGSPSHGFMPVDVDIDSQGRIVITGRFINTSDVCHVWVHRLVASGTMGDTTFTTFVQNPPGGYCGGAVSAVILGGDRVLVVSNWNNPDGSQRPLLTLINSDGTPDNTAFSGSYAVRLPNPSTTKMTLQPTRMVVDAMGRYVISGNKCDGGHSTTHAACESVVGRITASGVWDTTFGPAATGNLGYSSLVFGTTAATPQEQYFWSLALDASSNIIAVGFSENYTTGTIAKFTPNGAVDTSFGTSGRVTPVMVSGADNQDLTEVAFDSDGRIVIGGYAYSGGPLVLATRYSASGVLDTTFGVNGVASAPAAGLEPKMALQADGRIVLAGAYPRNGGGSDLALWRLWP